MEDVEDALAVYQEARERMDAAHELFVHSLGGSLVEVTAARAAFDRAEERMRRARRTWWLAIAGAQTDTARAGTTE